MFEKCIGGLEEALEFKAPPQAEIVEINSVCKTAGSDRLHNFGVHGYTVISSNINQTADNFGEPRYKVGDKVAYIAIDSVITEELEKLLFPPESKITLTGRRIKILKLRGSYSQGMIVDLDELESLHPGISILPVGSDISRLLGVKKYEPPEAPAAMKGNQVSRKKKNHFFHEYTDIRNLKHYTDKDVFEEGELVYVTAKLHGTSMRLGLLPSTATTLWQKIKKFFGLFSKFEYCIGSRRVQLQDKPKCHKGFYEKNVYVEAFHKLKLKDVLEENVEVFGELIFLGCQKNYTYGCKEGEYKFFAYDVMKNGWYLDPEEFKAYCDSKGLARVPDLGNVPFNLDKLNELASTKTCLNGQKTREGVVVKPLKDRSHPSCGRVALKLVNPAFLLENNTDWH